MNPQITTITKDGPDGKVTVEPADLVPCSVRLSIDLDRPSYLAIYLTPEEATRIAMALLTFAGYRSS